MAATTLAASPFHYAVSPVTIVPAESYTAEFPAGNFTDPVSGSNYSVGAANLTDACGDASGLKVSVSGTLYGFDDACNKVTQATYSMKITLPSDANTDDLESIVGFMSARIAAYAELS